MKIPIKQTNKPMRSCLQKDVDFGDVHLCQENAGWSDIHPYEFQLYPDYVR